MTKQANEAIREGRYTGKSFQDEQEIVAEKQQPAIRKTLQCFAKKALMTRQEMVLAKEQSAKIDLLRFSDGSGIITFSAWNTGAGNYKKARAIPDCAKVYWYHSALSTNCPEKVKLWFAAHPRAKRCIALL